MKNVIPIFGIGLVLMVVVGAWVFSFSDVFSDVSVGFRVFCCVFITLFGLFGCATIAELENWFE